MPLHLLDDDLWFPPVEDALDDGLLAVGGDLSPHRLLLAYEQGIFPWYNETDPPLWWCPDPRFVLYPDELRVSKSMKQVLRSGQFSFKFDTAFEQVIHHCRHTYREGQGGTWITDDVQEAYTQLHKMGLAHCAEAWKDGVLVGGLYGVWLGDIFFGESMFSHASNASKFAFINWLQFIKSQGVVLIDCQLHTPHLESLGGRMIPRAEFSQMLQRHIVF